jgi:hypothetical protein
MLYNTKRLHKFNQYHIEIIVPEDKLVMVMNSDLVMLYLPVFTNRFAGHMTLDRYYQLQLW